MIELFKTAAVRTSNPRKIFNVVTELLRRIIKESVMAYCTMLLQQMPVGNVKHYEEASRDSRPPD
jgi:hypothetical protein